RIPPEDLERSRMPAWRRWFGRFGAPSFDVIRPLATAVAGLGLAIAVLGGVFGSGLPGPGTAALVQSPTEAVGRGLAPGGSRVPTGASGQFGANASAAASAVAVQDGAAKATASPVPAAPPEDLRAPAPATGGQAPLPLPLIGLAAFVAGLGVVLLNALARGAAGR